MGSELNRREFMQAAGGLAGRAVVGSSLFSLGCDLTHFGVLKEPDANGIRLPPGFRSRIVAVSGETVPGTDHIWHRAPDGGAVFETHDGWIYTSNAELLFRLGGVGALRFDRRGELIDAYSICQGTRRNCAGGATPWGTWLTCEEVSRGIVFECDPYGARAQTPLPALGSFTHEAVAVDPIGQRLYMTEDRRDGRLYRYTPHSWGHLEAGVLEVAQVDLEQRVHWHRVPNPNPPRFGLSTRRQVPISTPFSGGEGIDYSDGHIYFVTKGDNRVWDLDLEYETLQVLYDHATDRVKQLSGVDNLLTTPEGDILVAEDGGNMELVLLGPRKTALVLLRVENQANSGLAGPAFDPSFKRLYFSSQRGFDGRGITYEVRGPFRSRRHHFHGDRDDRHGGHGGRDDRHGGHGRRDRD
ncbi:MAG: alkaline phosphatase PhoX [Myxococcota bacterium]